MTQPDDDDDGDDDDDDGELELFFMTHICPAIGISIKKCIFYSKIVLEMAGRGRSEQRPLLQRPDLVATGQGATAAVQKPKSRPAAGHPPGLSRQPARVPSSR